MASPSIFDYSNNDSNAIPSSPKSCNNDGSADEMTDEDFRQYYKAIAESKVFI